MSSSNSSKTLDKSTVSFAKSLAAVRSTFERTIINPIIEFYLKEKNITLTESELNSLYEKLEASVPMFSQKIKTVASQTVKGKAVAKKNTTRATGELCVYKFVRGEKAKRNESCKKAAKTNGYCGTHVTTKQAKDALKNMNKGGGRESVKSPGYVKPGAKGTKVNDPAEIKKTVDDIENNGIGLVEDNIYIKLDPTDFYISVNEDGTGQVYYGDSKDIGDEKEEEVDLLLKYVYENGKWRRPNKKEIEEEESAGSEYKKADKTPAAQLKEINTLVDLSKTDIIDHIPNRADLVRFSKLVGIRCADQKKVAKKSTTAELKCPDCDYTVSNKGAMTRHINTKHAKKNENNDLKCNLCDYKGGNKGAMTRHFKTMKHKKAAAEKKTTKVEKESKKEVEKESKEEEEEKVEKESKEEEVEKESKEAEEEVEEEVEEEAE